MRGLGSRINDLGLSRSSYGGVGTLYTTVYAHAAQDDRARAIDRAATGGRSSTHRLPSRSAGIRNAVPRASRLAIEVTCPPPLSSRIRSSGPPFIAARDALAMQLPQVRPRFQALEVRVASPTLDLSGTARRKRFAAFGFLGVAPTRRRST